jgi:hypothetical protein
MGLGRTPRRMPASRRLISAVLLLGARVVVAEGAVAAPFNDTLF